jgi:TolA-binding protein
MNAQRYLKAVLVATAVMVAVPVAAQTSITPADIQRLQDDVYYAGNDVARLRSTDAALATRLQDELDDLRDEVVYLKVKTRKEGNVPRAEYSDLRDRIQDLRSRARGETSVSRAPATPPQLYPGQAVGGTASGQAPSRGSGAGYGSGAGDRSSDRSTTTTSRGSTTIPVGQEIDVRLDRELSSDTAQVEDRFQATTVVDLYDGNRLLIPAGSAMRGVVSSVNRASRTDRKGSLTVSFDQVTVRGRDYPMRGTVTEALESEGMKGEIGRISAGSAIGGVIGGILGGVKGAVLGVLIGGGGTIAATEGKDVTLPPGTILRVRLDTPPDVR